MRQVNGRLRLLAAALVAGLIAVPAASQTTQTYIYDVFGRLVGTTTAKTTSGSATSYALDNADNRTSRARANTVIRAGGQQKLSSGEVMVPGQELKSTDNRFIFLFQSSDGNGALYWIGTGPLGWSTNTAGGTSLTLTMEAGGNLVMKNYAGTTIFQTGTGGNPGAYLEMLSNGNLVVKTSGGTQIWQSGTCCH